MRFASSHAQEHDEVSLCVLVVVVVVVVVVAVAVAVAVAVVEEGYIQDEREGHSMHEIEIQVRCDWELAVELVVEAVAVVVVAVVVVALVVVPEDGS